MPLDQRELTTELEKTRTKLNREIERLERDIESRDNDLDTIKHNIRRFCLDTGFVILALSLFWNKIGMLCKDIDFISFSYQPGFGLPQIMGVFIGVVLVWNGWRVK